MVRQEVFDGVEAYVCEECGLHYATRTVAQACEDYCNEHRSCSTEIMRYALEEQPDT